jgi:hypothetical protein
LALHVAGMIAFDIAPHFVDFDGDATQISEDQIVFRIEVPIERHLIGAGGLGDRFDADTPDAMTMEQVPGR